MASAMCRIFRFCSFGQIAKINQGYASISMQRPSFLGCKKYSSDSGSGGNKNEKNAQIEKVEKKPSESKDLNIASSKSSRPIPQTKVHKVDQVKDTKQETSIKSIPPTLKNQIRGRFQKPTPKISATLADAPGKGKDVVRVAEPPPKTKSLFHEEIVGAIKNNDIKKSPKEDMFKSSQRDKNIVMKARQMEAAKQQQSVDEKQRYLAAARTKQLSTEKVPTLSQGHRQREGKRPDLNQRPPVGEKQKPVVHTDRTFKRQPVAGNFNKPVSLKDRDSAGLRKSRVVEKTTSAGKDLSKSKTQPYRGVKQNKSQQDKDEHRKKKASVAAAYEDDDWADFDDKMMEKMKRRSKEIEYNQKKKVILEMKKQMATSMKTNTIGFGGYIDDELDNLSELDESERLTQEHVKQTRKHALQDYPDEGVTNEERAYFEELEKQRLSSMRTPGRKPPRKRYGDDVISEEEREYQEHLKSKHLKSKPKDMQPMVMTEEEKKHFFSYRKTMSDMEQEASVISEEEKKYQEHLKSRAQMEGLEKDRLRKAGWRQIRHKKISPSDAEIKDLEELDKQRMSDMEQEASVISEEEKKYQEHLKSRAQMEGLEKDRLRKAGWRQIRHKKISKQKLVPASDAEIQDLEELDKQRMSDMEQEAGVISEVTEQEKKYQKLSISKQYREYLTTSLDLENVTYLEEFEEMRLYEAESSMDREEEQDKWGEKLFTGESLEIFQRNMFERAPLASEGFSMWSKHDQELTWFNTHKPPANAIEDQLKWTNEGKMWRFPIDNEQDMTEENDVPFYDHIDLDQYIEGVEAETPVADFLYLAVTGLAKNPYLTAAEKKENVLWFKDYFQQKGTLDDLTGGNIQIEGGTGSEGKETGHDGKEGSIRIKGIVKDSNVKEQEITNL